MPESKSPPSSSEILLSAGRGLDQVLAAVHVGAWRMDLLSGATDATDTCKANFGLPPDASLTLHGFLQAVHPEDREATSAAFAAAIDPLQRALYDVEYCTVGKEDGIVCWVAAKGRGLFEAGACVRVVGVVIDITARKAAQARLQELNERLEGRVAEEVAERLKVEEALRQSQKMEAVGQLTGGIAHDFNNMLAAVIGPLDLLAARMGDDDARARRYVDMAIDGARRAALLTQRLLAFSRQQPLQPVALDANRLVAGMSDLLVHSLGSSVRLETVLGAGLWWTHADANQLELAILNLCINAKDAMPDGGRIVIEARWAKGDEAALVSRPDGYVRLSIRDTGTGMDPATIERAIEPFFSTKGVGKGTGLGLSMVHGFAVQSSGSFVLDSRLGQGTRAVLYLPVSGEGVAPRGGVGVDLVDDGLHGERHGADEYRQPFATLHQGGAGLGMIEAVAGIARLRDDRIERGAVQRRVHLVDDLLEPALEDREGDGIETHGFPFGR